MSEEEPKINTPGDEPITIVLEMANLEIVKAGKDYQLLNCDDHAHILRKHKRDPVSARGIACELHLCKPRRWCVRARDVTRCFRRCVGGREAGHHTPVPDEYLRFATQQSRARAGAQQKPHAAVVCAALLPVVVSQLSLNTVVPDPRCSSTQTKMFSSKSTKAFGFPGHFVDSQVTKRCAYRLNKPRLNPLSLCVQG